LWIGALAIDLVGPMATFWTPGLGRSSTHDWNIEGSHMAERCGLFIIIALGESILVTGATFAELEWTGPVVAAFTASFLGSVAMWWIYFNASAAAGRRIIATSSDPGRLGRSAYTYMHLPIVAGIIVTAVGDELVLAHPTGHTETATTIAVLGGPVLFIIGTVLFKWTLGRSVNLVFLAAVLIAFAALVPIATVISPALLSAAVTLALTAICAADVITARAQDIAAAPTGEPDAAG